MKKLVALFLAVALLCACTPAAMALTADDIFGAFDDTKSGSWGYPYDHSVWKELVEFQINADAVIYADVYMADGTLFNHLASGEVYKAGDTVVLNWPAVDVNGWHPGIGSSDFYVLVAAVVNGETVYTRYDFTFNFAHDMSAHDIAKWYPHNTICVAGVEFRYAKPELTNKWYNFAVLDLSHDGTQTYDLVASNLYVIGTVTVNVSGDEVTVDWKLRRQGTNDSNFMLEDEFMTIFSSLDAVTELEPENFEGPTYEFGQPISIANDLGGDTTVLLYIRNVATYCNNLSYKYLQPIYHAPYAHGENSRLITRNAMMAMLDADAIR